MVRTRIGGIKVVPCEITHGWGPDEWRPISDGCTGESYHPIIDGEIIKTVKIQSNGNKHTKKFKVLGWCKNDCWSQVGTFKRKDLKQYVKYSMESSPMTIVPGKMENTMLGMINTYRKRLGYEK